MPNIYRAPYSDDNSMGHYYPPAMILPATETHLAPRLKRSRKDLSLNDVYKVYSMKSPNYDFSFAMFSLKTMCMVKVINEIIQASYAAKRQGDHYNCLNYDVRCRLDKLPLPESMIESAKILVMPILNQLKLWYMKFKHWNVKPVWTPQGTVDIIGGAKVLIRDETIPICFRYSLACAFFLPKYIFRTRPRLSALDLDFIVNQPLEFCKQFSATSSVPRIAKMWLDVAQDASNQQTEGRGRLQQIYDECLKCACNYGDEFEAICYAPSASNVLILKFFKSAFSRNPFMTPALLCSLCLKLSPKYLLYKAQPVNLQLLYLFLRWPYQHYFIKLLNSLVDYVRHDELMMKVRRKATYASAYSDYNYEELYDAFCKVVDSHKNKKKLSRA